MSQGSRPGPNFSLIPMTWNDSRFGGNVASALSGTFPPPATISNQDWNDSPTYPSGNQVWTHGGSGPFAISKCRVDWREGPRLGGPVAATDSFSVDQCYINCVGATGDHADSFQAFVGIGGGQAGPFQVTNTFIHAYTDVDAANVYGAGFIGSTGLFYSDDSFGNITFNNVIFRGGDRVLTIDQSAAGQIHVSLNKVYFVPTAGAPPLNWSIRVGNNSSANIVIDNWTNVFFATIVNNVLIPGASIAFPGFGNTV